VRNLSPYYIERHLDSLNPAVTADVPVSSHAHKSRWKRLTLWLTGLTLAVLAVAAMAWRWWTPRPAALERHWTATALVIAGDGVPGLRDGDASLARFSDPFGVAVGAHGTIYVSDAGDANSIRAISTDGRVLTLAGGGAGFVDGPAGVARFRTPSGLAIDGAGTLFVADTGNNAIRRIGRDGNVTTIAGDGAAGFRDGPGSVAHFNGPVGVAVDAGGRVIVADTYNDRIRAIAPDGMVSTLAGYGAPGMLDGAGGIALFDTPSGVAVDASGAVFVADTANGVVRMVSPTANNEVTTLASPPDGLVRPVGIAVGAEGEVFVTDDRGRVTALSIDGASRTLAGSTPGFRDGPGSEARFRNPAGVAVAASGRLIVADAGNALVRVVAAPSRGELRAPASARVAPQFDVEHFGIQPLLWPVAPMEGPHEIAGTLGEARGSEGSERFHAGVDVRKEEGTLVLAVRDGMVTSPAASGDFGSLNEWLRIGSVAYVHIRAGRELKDEVFDPERFVPTYDEMGKLVRIRVKRGARFSSGEAIGSVNAFNHVHVNVGWPGEEYNPLRFRLMHFSDTIPPTIARGGVRVFDQQGQPLTLRQRGRVLVSGHVQVVVDAWDQAEGNRRDRRLGLYELGYQVLNRDRAPVAGFDTIHKTLRFDRLALDPYAARLVYAHGSGIPFYRGRRTRFLYVVTNTLQEGVASGGYWDTTLLPPGDYMLRVWAADIAGNSATRDLSVTIAPQ
jgi:sugar lactone lactonase YvrE